MTDNGYQAVRGGSSPRDVSAVRGGSGGSSPQNDAAAVAAQLGRMPRGIRRVAARCPCGLPAVIETAPRLPDGTPFPTLFYLTCPKAASAIGSLEGGGLMRDMQARLAADPKLKAGYEAAHDDYLRRRDEAAREDGIEPLPAGMQSAGGMPERVKCLHALIAHELAVPGVNPFGREGLEKLPEWWRAGPCVCTAETPRPETPEPGSPETGTAQSEPRRAETRPPGAPQSATASAPGAEEAQ